MDARSEKLNAICIVLNRDEQAKFETSTVVSGDRKYRSVDVIYASLNAPGAYFWSRSDSIDLTEIRS